ncbi:MAG: hypothetical protein CMH83_17525 [Nocardioides sp.]|nr:hypothetical protein [Nocardioides sp.]
MRPLKRLEQAELPALAMENELLRYEVTHLRGRLAAAEQTAEQAVEELRRREGEAAAAAVVPEAVAADPALADPARDDLVWLLQRLEGLPIAPLMRRREGYRRLLRDYLGNPGSGPAESGEPPAGGAG